MRGIAGLSLILALAQLLNLGLAVPILQSSTSELLSRDEFCFNAPGTKAGTFLGRRADDMGGSFRPPPPPSGAHSVTSGDFPGEAVVWCQSTSRTYLRATWLYPLAGISWVTTQSVIAVAIAMVHQQLQAGGDELVSKGAFQYGISGAQVYTANSNNHQLTLGVLGSALSALASYCTYLQDARGVTPGRIQFTVVDGGNEVGRGFFGHESPPPADPPAAT